VAAAKIEESISLNHEMRWHRRNTTHEIFFLPQSTFCERSFHRHPLGRLLKESPVRAAHARRGRVHLHERHIRRRTSTVNKLQKLLFEREACNASGASGGQGDTEEEREAALV